MIRFGDTRLPCGERGFIVEAFRDDTYMTDYSESYTNVDRRDADLEVAAATWSCS